MKDIAKDSFDTKHLSQILKVPVCLTNGRTGEGIESCVEALKSIGDRGYEQKSHGEVSLEESLKLSGSTLLKVKKRSLLQKSFFSTKGLDRFFLHPKFGFLFFFAIMFSLFFFCFLACRSLL